MRAIQGSSWPEGLAVARNNRTVCRNSDRFRERPAAQIDAVRDRKILDALHTTRRPDNSRPAVVFDHYRSIIVYGRRFAKSGAGQFGERCYAPNLPASEKHVLPD